MKVTLNMQYAMGEKFHSACKNTGVAGSRSTSQSAYEAGDRSPTIAKVVTW
ncbi:MAG: hypothetical protein PHV02_18345 [Rhodocyclaceae bacterium]|nr:hypothetical protein [Rhodocyclaceae bacterium]